MKKVSHQLAALCGLFVAALIALGIFSLVRFRTAVTNLQATESKARVNGALYRDIVQTKDVLADVLPPPAYLIESYLTSLQLADSTDSSQRERLVAKLAQLRTEFDNSRNRWLAELQAGKLKEAFAHAMEPASRFYEIVDRELIPSLDEPAKAKHIVRTSLLKEYTDQRNEVDKIVAAASARDSANKDALQALLEGNRVAVAQEIRTSTTLIGSAIGVFLVLSLAVGGFIALRLTKTLRNSTTELKVSAEQTCAAAAQVAATSQTLAEGSSEQAASLEQTSASLEEMSSMTKHNAENASQAKDLSSQARKTADVGVADMAEMHQAMAEIVNSSQEIAKIIKTIDEIAFQTNILALNAAVEAARAGEAGAGFAVVADEVRQLAQRSAHSARETAGKIEEAIAKSENGARISEKVGSSLEQIVQKTRSVDLLMGEIAEACQQQSQGIGQLTTTLGQMDLVTQSNASGAEETASAAEELNGQAAIMNEAVATLERLVSDNKAAQSSHAIDSRIASPAEPPLLSGQKAPAKLHRP